MFIDPVKHNLLVPMDVLHLKLPAFMCIEPKQCIEHNCTEEKCTKKTTTHRKKQPKITFLEK